MEGEEENRLYFGDNLDILQRYIASESVDLVYLDPPFNSDATYNVLFREHNGTDAAAQIRVFEDTWHWDLSAARAYQETVEAGGKVSEALQAFRKLVGDSDMLAYVSMMAPRLKELHRVLKPTGSIYLHCDPTASHYLKLLMDAVFVGGFQSEVIWSYRRWPTKTKNYQHMHDILLYYVKGRPPVFNVLYEPASESFLHRFKGKANILDKGATKKRPSEKDTPGLPMRDVWEISIIAGSSKERLGYPTQKPLALLERVIEVSSNRDQVVLDPFCGCGTTIDAAQKLGRGWIGIDITHLAINLLRHRLCDAYGEGIYKTFTVIGEPTTVSDARVLAERDRYQFQWWALGLVGARPAETKKGADKGIDGRLYFHDDPGSQKTKQIVFSVKAGKPSVAHVRDLRGVVEREQAEMGVMISMLSPTKDMRTEAANAGFYESSWGKHPRIQLLTISDLLAGKHIDMPPATGANVTFKKGRKNSPDSPLQMRLRETEEGYGADSELNLYR
ncbi:MAG: restriction endonuclease [Candidatus Hydrogenedentes bacterium]|nr:restriction endonuclease [Candidatus Hydrogenedentota bacterium]